jgi:sugar lactone lactonase YvrE
VTDPMTEPDWTELPLGDHVLAESPRWHAGRRRLSWVDIVAGSLAWSTWDGGGWGAVQRHSIGRMPTAAEPLDGQEAWAVAVDGAVRVFGVDGAPGPAVPVCAGFPEVRTNDMTRDPSGRLLVGLFTEDRSSARGGVAAVDLEGGVTSVVVEGLVTANGLAVAPDGASLYAVDTARATISRHRLGADEPDPGSVFVRHLRPGVLDGIAFGPDGELWVAVWDAGALHRYAPGGRLRSVLRVPVARPSAVAVADIGGTAHLVITTARSDLAQRPPLRPSPEGRLYATPLPD